MTNCGGMQSEVPGGRGLFPESKEIMNFRVFGMQEKGKGVDPPLQLTRVYPAYLVDMQIFASVWQDFCQQGNTIKKLIGSNSTCDSWFLGHYIPSHAHTGT